MSPPHPRFLRIPERSPCRRSLWNRSCLGVAGGWDPASSLPSSLSPYLLLAFSPPRLNRTSFSSFLSPLSNADPLVFVFNELLAPLRMGNSKESGPLRTQSTGFAAWKNRSLKDRSPQRHCLLYLSFAREEERIALDCAMQKYSAEKSRRERVILNDNFQILDIKVCLLILLRKIARGRTRREVMIFISTLIQ